MRALQTSSPAALAARVAELGVEALRPHLLAEVPPVPVEPSQEDYHLMAAHRPPGQHQLRPAAVLLPIVARAEPTILFTRRTPHLARHAGQVSFPGGRVHEDDRSLVETALRETEEETGITADYVSVAGFLDAREVGTGFAIMPVVGIVREGFALVPDPGEVDEIFEVPLTFLLDPANRQRRSIEAEQIRREFYAFTYGTHYIWGATAGILVNFLDRLAAS